MKQAIDIAEIANRLIGYGVPGWAEPSAQHFPRAGEGISIPPNDIDRYYSAVNELFQVERGIKKSYFFRTFEKHVFAFIAPYVLKGTRTNAKAVQGLLRTLDTAPLFENDVYRPIYRITKGQTVGQVVLGPFTIFHTKRDSAALDSRMAGRLDDVLLETAGHYLIHTRVSARDELIALETADELFEKFENTIRFMTGPSSNFDISIFRGEDFPRQRAIVLSPASGSSSVGRDSIPSYMDIDDSYFLRPDLGFEKIWRGFGESSLTDFMSNILLAVTWIGQSIAEKVPSSAFVKAAIALEVLFAPAKGFIVPGIIAQLSDSVAMLLGRDAGSRLALEKTMKNLYSVRSSVAHAGSTDVDRGDLRAVQALARDSVIKLLTADAFKDAIKSTDIQEILKKFRYSCPEI